MADPIIVAYGRGKLNEFPAKGEVPIDLIPVDFVANAMLASLPIGEDSGDGMAVYQCASSERNPLPIHSLVRWMQRAFERRPMSGENGRAIHVRRLRIVEKEVFVRRWKARYARITLLHRILTRLGFSGRRGRRLAGLVRQIDQVVYFAKIYSPYTHLDCRFADDALRGAFDRLHPEDQAGFPFDPERIDWEDYIVNRHIPGLRSYVLGSTGEPAPRILGVGDGGPLEEAPRRVVGSAGNLFELFSRTAERHPGKTAFQVRRNGRWVKYSYEDALRATGTIMQRFGERGLCAGDRVGLLAENSPEWGLTYLAMMRAGLTAIPLDRNWAGRRGGRRFASRGEVDVCEFGGGGEAAFDARIGGRGVGGFGKPVGSPAGASRDASPAPRKWGRRRSLRSCLLREPPSHRRRFR